MVKTAVSSTFDLVGLSSVLLYHELTLVDVTRSNAPQENSQERISALSHGLWSQWSWQVYFYKYVV